MASGTSKQGTIAVEFLVGEPQLVRLPPILALECSVVPGSFSQTTSYSGQNLSNWGKYKRRVKECSCNKAPVDEGESETRAKREPCGCAECQKHNQLQAEDIVYIHGLAIRIENPPGSVRSGVGKDGPWSVTMQHAYGEIIGVDAFGGDVHENESIELNELIHIQESVWV